MAVWNRFAEEAVWPARSAGCCQGDKKRRLLFLRTLALAAEYRDVDAFEHTTRVADTASLLAVQIGFSDTEVALIRQAAPLHDIGKLAVSDCVLRKPGRLTREEFEHVKQHASAGAAILGDGSEVLSLASEIALSHHEWWDGNGYPRGLKAEKIPLSGRIVALADVFDALTHRRPYKQAWTTTRAIAEIDRLNGRQFDPTIVAAFHELNRQEVPAQ